MATGNYLEGQIDGLMRRVAFENGYLLLDSVLLDLRVKTADLPYVFLDRHGILIVGVECWPGMGISGSSAANAWSGKSSTLGRMKFENPFEANRARTQVLQEALSVCGRRLSPDYITSVVVFMGADLRRLKLDSPDKARLVDAKEFECWIHQRADFPPNPGAMEQEQIDDLISLLRALNRADSDEVRARHASQRSQRGKSRSSTAVSEVALSDSLTCTAPSAPRLESDRYPTPSSIQPRRATSLFALVAVVALAVWFFAYRGYELAGMYVARFAATQPTQRAQPPRPVQPVPRSTPDVLQAERALAEVAPHILKRVADLDSPQVSARNGVTLYTWEYVNQTASGAKVGTYTLGLDATGRVVHVSQRQ